MSLRVKDYLRVITPNVFLNWRARRLRARAQSHFAELSNATAFSQIYAQGLWGGEQGQFFSGSGSDAVFADSYVSAIRSFIVSSGAERVVDIGCGDFRIGARLREGVDYIGVDVVPELIASHQRQFANEHTSFLCLDATAEPLPPGDICLVRQVLQHLSNREILRVLDAASKYPYLIVTEHFPAAEKFVSANRDKPHGPDIRVVDGSAVCVDQPPFNRLISRVLCEVSDPGDRSIIRTVLIDQRL